MTSVTTTTPEEWAAIALDVEAGWGKPFTAEQEAGWVRLLDGHFPAGVLLASVRRLVIAGRGAGNPFPPSAAEVAAEANLISFPHSAPVSWTEFWAAMTAARRHRDFPRSESIGQQALFAGQVVGAELGPICGGYAAMIWERSARMPLEGPDASPTALAGLRREFDEHQGIMRERLLRGARIPTSQDVLQRSGRRPREIDGARRPASALLEAGE